MIIDSVNKNKSTPRAPPPTARYRGNPSVIRRVSAAAAAAEGSTAGTGEGDGVLSCPGPAPETFTLT